MEVQGIFEILHGFYKVDPQPKRRCGCYIRIPNVLEIKQENVMVPLKNIDYDIEIVNSLVHITLVQTYENPSEKFLELEYSFPLDPKSCIYRFVAEFGNNVIEGIVKQKQEAKQEYKKAIKEGRQAAYGQISEKSSDIMNMEIGNVPPKTQVKITISILQELDLSMSTFYKLHVPSTISPRYINDYNPINLKEKLINVDQPKSVKSGVADFTWSFKINVKTNKKITFFDSPSHEIVLQNQTDKDCLLTMSKQCIPNKDFIFYYTTEDFHLPSYVLGRTDVSSTVMLSFIPKFCTLSVNDAYKAEVEHKSFEADIDAAKGQFIFLLDRSGSMGGKRIQKATEALSLFLKSLPSDSYFNVVSFGSRHEFMFKNSEKYVDVILEKALKDVKTMKADLGGTQIEQPLKIVLNSKLIDGYPKQIFLLTDGDVSNTNNVINLVQRNIKYARVHSIGIGSGASIALIKGCAQKGKGKHIFINDSENPSEKIIDILGQALSPVISKVELKYDESIVKSIVPNPASIPYILKDDLVNFYITFKGQIQKETQFTFKYIDSQNKMPYTTEITVNPQSQSQPFVDKMAHYKVIKNLEKASKKEIVLEDHMFYVKNVDYKQSAIDQSIKNQVLSQYTAFICVGKQLVDGEYQQYANKGVEKIQIQQPIVLQEKQSYPGASYSSSFYGQPKLDCYLPPPRAQIEYFASQEKCMIRASKPQMALAKKSVAQKSQSSGFFESIIGAASNLFGSAPRSKKQEAQQSKSMKPDQRYTDARSDQRLPRHMNKIEPQQAQAQQMNDFADFQKESLGPLYQHNEKLKELLQDMEDDDEEMNASQQVTKKKKKKINEQKRQRRSSPKSELNSSVQIKEVISAQKSNGSWVDQSLFKRIFPMLDESIEQLIKQFSKQIVMTYLIATWIQQKHPDKQYALLVKKALSWCKKTSEQKGLDSEQLKVLQKAV